MNKSDILHFGILIAFSCAVGNFFWQYSENIVQNTSVVVSEVGISNSISSSIKIKTPIALSQVASPVVVAGRALEKWFSEGAFSVKILDEDGNILGDGSAKALGNSTSNGFVPFEGSVVFSKKDATAGFLLFEQPEVSGNSDVVKTAKIPVNF